jgi:pimeloyl-ACP methyl ester carboxylesterase
MKSPQFLSLCGLALVLSLSGCTAPIGADRVTVRQAYHQLEANALGSGKPGADTVSILHRYGLDEVAARRPDQAVTLLHKKAVETGERDLLYALAEMSYIAGDHVRRSVKPWDTRDSRDFYLGSAVYAWLFLFGESKEPAPSAFDRRSRNACDLYNYGLGLALAAGSRTNLQARLESGPRRLPVGVIEVRIDATRLPAGLGEFETIVMADQYRVRGLSVRNRQAGIGAPLVCAKPVDDELQMHPSIPATAVLRGPSSLGQLNAADTTCPLEIYPVADDAMVSIGSHRVPLEVDLTTYRAYTLNQSRVWKLGRLDFLAPAEHVRNQLILNQPYDPDRIPVVFVHGTFSSPVTWAEMANTLIADPLIRRRYQVWSFIYGSSNPLIYSIGDLRLALTEKVKELDPQGTNSRLQEMVIIGHSQGGLLTKCAALDSGDQLWKLASTKPLEELQISDAQRVELRRLMFFKPLPFVKRVVFIATPHRGSYLSGSLARQLGRRLVRLPQEIASKGSSLVRLTQGSEVGNFIKKSMPTSLDGMSPKHPALLAVAEIPVVPSVKAHSIIPVQGDGDPRKGGRDGVVAYSSAHVDYVESEFIVRSGHSCLNNPAAIEEVRRILRLHLAE